jgi:hypothetical protein
VWCGPAGSLMHHGNSDVWHYAMSEFQMFSSKKTPLLVQIFRLYIYIQIHVCASFSILTNKLCIKFTTTKKIVSNIGLKLPNNLCLFTNLL